MARASSVAVLVIDGTQSSLAFREPQERLGVGGDSGACRVGPVFLTERGGVITQGGGEDHGITVR